MAATISNNFSTSIRHECQLLSNTKLIRLATFLATCTQRCTGYQFATNYNSGATRNGVIGVDVVTALWFNAPRGWAVHSMTRRLRGNYRPRGGLKTIHHVHVRLTEEELEAVNAVLSQGDHKSRQHVIAEAVIEFSRTHRKGPHRAPELLPSVMKVLKNN